MICQNIEWLAWPPPLFLTAGPYVLGHRVEVGDELLDVAGVGLGVLLQGGV
jgi:hypothetical protein